MTEKSKGQKWDGKSRVSNDLYRKNYDDIFKKELRLRNKTGVTATTKRDIGHSQELSFGFPPPVNSDQIISPRVATASARRASGPGQQIQATSSKPQATSSQASSDKPQAPSNKRQAPSRKRQAP